MSVVGDLTRLADSDADRRVFLYLADGETPTAALTFGELDERARRVAAALEESGARRGDRALLLYRESLEFVPAFFGCLYAGVLAVPIGLPRRAAQLETRIRPVIEDARPHFVLGANADRDTVGGWGLPWLSTDELPDVDARAPADVRDDEVAFLQYTSGSTTAPKGVMVTHGNLRHNSGMIGRTYAMSPSSVGVCWLPLFHDMGLVFGVVQPVVHGFETILMPPVAFLRAPGRWLGAVTRYGGTHAYGPNFGYDLCVERIAGDERASFDLRTWTVACNGAEPVRPRTRERFEAAFGPCGFRRSTWSPAYGLAEGTLMVAANPAGADPVELAADRDALAAGRLEPAPSDPQARLLSGCGRVDIGLDVRVVDSRTRCECEDGVVGEIWVRGGSVAAGYWNQPETTAETFAAQLADGDGPYLRTGDLGTIAHGQLVVTGRSKDVIIVRGEVHYPQDLELTVETCHPSVRPGCSAAFSIDEDGEELVVVAAETDAAMSAEDVVEAIRAAVAEEHGLRVHAVCVLPPGAVLKTSSGKIMRSACRSAFVGGAFDAAPAART